MPQRMTTKCVAAQEHDVDRQNNRADADAERLLLRRRSREPHRFPGIIGEDQNKNEREIKKVAMHILHDERERTFTEISFARFADGTGRRIRPESFVIRTAVIIAGETKTS